MDYEIDYDPDYEPSDELDYEPDYEPGEEPGEEPSELKDEFNAFQRAGGGSNIGLVGIDGKIDQIILDPLSRFKIQVDARARTLKDSVYINDKDIKILLETSEKLQYVNYKNSTLYILGYIVSNGGREIKQDKFKMVVTQILPIFNDDSIKGPDIIRYGRLWTEQLNP